MSGNRSVTAHLLGAALLLSFFMLLACNSGSYGPQASGNSVSIVGAGSTFVYPIMTRWISDFQSTHSGVQINYQSIGSGGGIQQLKKNLVDFGASDAALDDQQLKERCRYLRAPDRFASPITCRSLRAR